MPSHTKAEMAKKRKAVKARAKGTGGSSHKSSHRKKRKTAN